MQEQHILTIRMNSNTVNCDMHHSIASGSILSEIIQCPGATNIKSKNGLFFQS